MNLRVIALCFLATALLSANLFCRQSGLRTRQKRLQGEGIYSRRSIQHGGAWVPEPLSWQTTQPEFRDRYTHFVKDGDFDAFNKKVAETRDAGDRRKTPTYLWSSRQDVWINYLGKHGDLTVGYGAPKEGFGPDSISDTLLETITTNKF